MDERTPTRRNAVPWGLVGLVVLVAAIESSAESHRGDFSTLCTEYFEFSSRAARSDAIGRDLLFLGDSVVKFGVLPRVIDERTGLRSYNLATSGNPAPVAHLLLRQALEAGARPRAVFVDFKPAVHNNYHPEIQSLARIAGPRDGFELAWTARHATYLGTFLANWALPTFRDRLPIHARIRNALQGLPAPTREHLDAHRRNWEVNRGAEVLPPNPIAATTSEFSNEKGNLRPGWKCHPINVEYIAKFFRLAAEHRVRVYWLLTPIHPRLQAGRDRLGIDDALTRFVREQAEAAGPGVVVVDGRRLGLDADLFVDATHPDRRGSVAFSQALGEFLRDREALGREDRWVVLPPRARPVDDPRIEDTDQSAVALRTGEGTRRR
jgi:hypothetical protein